MKHTVQARPHGGTKAPSLQPKIRRRRVENPPVPAASPAALFFFDNEKEELIGTGIDLTAAEFAAIQQDAAALGESLDAWLIRTLAELPVLSSLANAGRKAAI